MTSSGRRRGRWRIAVAAGAGLMIFVAAIVPLLAQRGRGAAAPVFVPGDAAKGKALVTSSKCLDCHRIGETGSRVGPDLSEVGMLRQPDMLRSALVTPDAEVYPDQRSMRVVTREGTTIVGRLLNQDAFSLQLMTPDEALRSYSKTSLREFAIVEKGLMPSYQGKLTADEITDIVAYLASLRGVLK